MACSEFDGAQAVKTSNVRTHSLKKRGRASWKNVSTRFSSVTRRKHASELCNTARWYWLLELLDSVVASLSHRLKTRQLHSQWQISVAILDTAISVSQSSA